MKRSKSYRSAAEKIDADKAYSPLEAVRLAKSTASAAYAVVSAGRRGRSVTVTRPADDAPQPVAGPRWPDDHTFRK